MLKKLSISLLLGATVLSLRAQSLTKNSASSQLSRSLTENLVSVIDSTDHFLIAIVKDVIPEAGVKFIPPEDFRTFETEGIDFIPVENATYTYTEPGVYVIVPFKDEKPQGFGNYVVVNEDYIDYYTSKSCPFDRKVKRKSIVSLANHYIGDQEMPILCQALWDQ